MGLKNRMKNWLLRVLPLSPDLLLNGYRKPSQNLKGQGTCGAREGLELKRRPSETSTREKPGTLKHPAQTCWYNSLDIFITNTKDLLGQRDGP